MATLTLEERVATLEAEIAELKAKRTLSDLPSAAGRTAPDFLDRFVGIHAGSRMAEEVLAQVEEERERERAEAQKAADDEEGGA